ncbi:methionyl-tRNA formyltransferase [Algoriphagus sediminis]|uniref:Formyltransferase family protein n=1 Tax=Algoriphagus sediminis TaxID=3057113 RepID=A0ABT7Y7J8_9BACT|nr:formyltransferase family protein [Algoriphagus sediminis]MDN3202505.1 formyltransferase family protein [Algoriphagus sediminis]
MKVLFFTNSIWSLSSLYQLSITTQLGGVVVTERDAKKRTELVEAMESQKWDIIPWSNDGDLVQIIQDQKIDLGLMLGFKKLIPKHIIDAFPKGVINIHFGSLPKYAGPDPLFWTLKNGEKQNEITFHQIDENWDSGIALSKKIVQIFPGENYGLLGARLANTVALELPRLLTSIESGLDGIGDIPINPKPLGKPTGEEIRIDWRKQSSQEIEYLVNACNPAYGGAITSFRGGIIRIMEVSPADMDNQGAFSPGSIIYSDGTYGVFVLCSDFKCLRINILKVDQSYISSQKFAALGVTTKDILV